MRILGFKDHVEREGGGIPPAVMESVNSIVAGVRKGGDRALLDYTKRFDGAELGAGELAVGERELGAALDSISDEERGALERSAGRIRRFQELQMPRGFEREIAPGVRVGVTYDPLESVGLYVPGGRAAYPSTVLMTAIPAKVAGVASLIMCTPPGKGGETPKIILAAAKIAGVDRVFRAGGAQAIAAMAYGTATIPRVEKIFGPGNIYVTAAKFAVSREVGIDLPAGPSDVLVYAEEGAPSLPRWIAADMLAQSEHDPMARAILVTPSRKLAESVNSLLEAYEGEGGIPEGSLREGSIFLVKDRDEGIRAINAIAPEHLQLFCRGEEELMGKVRNAGAVFLGKYAPVALGDYTAGTNHVLPTMGWSRRASPLSVRDFLRSREHVRCTPAGLRSIGMDAVTLAEAEGLKRHADSIRIRLEEDNGK